MDAPRISKGLDAAVDFLQLISNKEELSKIVAELKKYNDEAKEYFQVYGGIVQAKKEAHNIIKAAEIEAEKIVAEAKTMMARVEKDKSDLQITRDRVSLKIQEVDKRIKEANDKEKEVEAKVEAAGVQEARIAEQASAVAAKLQEIMEKQEILAAKEAKIKELTKGFGEI